MSRGKKVDVFKFNINGLKVDIDVKIVKNDDNGKSSFRVDASKALPEPKVPNIFEEAETK